MEDVAKTKMTMNLMRSMVTEVKWEKRWLEFILRVWETETPGWDWDQAGCIYEVTIPFSKKEYVGVTKLTVFERWKSHLRKVACGTQTVYRALRKAGAYPAVITPLKYCGGHTEKVAR